MGKGEGEGEGGGEVEVKFSDLNTESSFFDLRTESVIGDPALRSGACEGGDISLPPPPNTCNPLELRTPIF